MVYVSDRQNIVVLTDAEGKFSLPGVPAADVVLIVQAAAYQQQRLAVNASLNAIAVTMPLAYTEVIEVTGRAPVLQKTNLANGASVVKGEEMVRVSSQTVDDAMQGKVAGANIQSNSGAPGGGLQVRLRGVSTINGLANPLYVIDGVIVSDVAIPSGIQEVTLSSRGSNASAEQDNAVNRIADLNPNDIESIEILKGAAAAALYGSKASNGVIIITTKRGTKGDVRVNVTQRFGTYQAANKLGTRRFTSVDEAVEAFGEGARDFYQDGVVYDHEEQILRGTSLATETAASVSGGNDSTTYFGSMMLRDDPGILEGTFYEKQTGRMAFTHKFTDRFKISGTTTLMHSTTARGVTQNDNAGVSHYMVFPFTPSFLDLSQRPDGSYPMNPFIGSNANPLQTVALMSDEEDVWRALGSLNANFTAFQNESQSLQFNGNFGVDRFQQKNNLFFPPELFFEPTDGLAGTSLDTSSESLNMNVDFNTVHTFLPVGGGWRAITSAGFQFEERRLDRLYVTSRNLTAGQPNVDFGTQLQINEARLKVQDQGLYVQEQVVLLEDSLSLLAAVRGEQSSVNGDPDKLFFYPKAAATYSIPGMPEQIETLRARVAFGQAGNQPLYGQKFTPLAGTNNIEGNPGILVGGTAGDPTIEPERQTEFEFGVDFVGFEGRGVFEATAYDKTITNLLLQRTLAPSTGFTTQFFNGGELRNRGLELMVQVTPVKTGGFEWVSRNIFSLNRSKVIDLPDGVQPFLVGGFGTGLGAFRIEEGASATQIVGNDGLKEDGTCCEINKLGDVEPTFRMSFVNNFTYENLGLTSLWDWQQGSDVINLTRFLYDLGQNSPDYVEAGAERLMNQATDAGVYIEDGTFLKLREVSLYYRMPESVTRQLGPVDTLQLSVSGRNLITLTNYSGLDPEVSNFGRQSIARNIDVAPYPPSRSFWLSLEASL